MVGFTPGPWRIANCDVLPTEGDDGRRFLDIMSGEEHRSNCDRYVSGYIDCGGRSICMVQHGPREADARLIAAAPELFEALSALLPALLCGESWNLPDTEHVSIDVTFGKLKAARAALAKVTA